jgi:hypothetical protein
MRRSGCETVEKNASSNQYGSTEYQLEKVVKSRVVWWFHHNPPEAISWASEGKKKRDEC